MAKMESECLDHKENYFNLIEQLKEEGVFRILYRRVSHKILIRLSLGAMLEKKDQDRLKKALQGDKRLHSPSFSTVTSFCLIERHPRLCLV